MRTNGPSPGGAAATMPSAPNGIPPTDPKGLEFERIVASLHELAEDGSVPRNVRRGAQAAKSEIERPRVALDVRLASAVHVLDELANDPNLPTHGRTAIWSMISRLESLQ